MACYIYQLPSRVLDDLCRNIDTLSEWDWMQFGECVAYFRPGPRPSVFPEAGGWGGSCLGRCCFALVSRLKLPVKRGWDWDPGSCSTPTVAACCVLPVCVLIVEL